jgi:branched-chain amino acid aminotransferase
MSSDWVAYVDGEWGPAEAASVNVLDHGLLYGDGVFEGIRYYGREPFLLDAHLRRLEASARALALELPLERADLAELCREGARRSATDDGYLRLVVTRGRGALGVSPHTCGAPSLILIAAPLALYPEEARLRGVRIVTSALRRAANDALPPQVKSLNYLTSVLASIEARRQGAEEAILLNAQGLISECTADNLFVVHGGRVRTPATAHGALDGITRALVLDLLAGLGIPAEAAPLVPVDAWTADEIFLTGTGAEIVRVREVDGRPVGEHGRPVTERVERAFADYVAGRSWVEPSTRTQVPAGR